MDIVNVLANAKKKTIWKEKTPENDLPSAALQPLRNLRRQALPTHIVSLICRL